MAIVLFYDTNGVPQPVDVTDGAIHALLTDGSGTAIKQVDNKLRVSSMPYLYDIAEGNVSGHTLWSKIGFNPALTTEEDIWSAGGLYVFPTGATQMEVVSSLSTADVDIGTKLFDATCDVGGTTTTLIDAGVNFSATAAAGDILILDKSGTVPEWGIITTAANGSLTFTGGLSSGGSCATARAYQVLDVSAAKGAMAVKIEYLTTAYVQKTEIVILNVNNAVPLINADVFRVNSFRVIAIGTLATALNAPGGNLSLKKNAGLTYSYITAGFTRARNSVYTVPIGKTLYVTQFSASFGTSGGPNKEYARIYTRANREVATGFLTGNLFYPYTEVMAQNNTVVINLDCPTKLPAMTDIKISAVATASGAVSTVLRGWLE